MELYIEHISKQFRDIVAVDDVSLCITPGVWGLLRGKCTENKPDAYDCRDYETFIRKDFV